MKSHVSHGVPLGRKLTLLAASTLTIMAGAMIAPSLPFIEAQFADMPNAGDLTRLVLTMPALFIVLFSPIAGIIADRIGRKLLLVVSVILYILAGTSGFFLPTLTTILISRAFLGIGVAGAITVATTLIGDYFAGPARGRFMGLQSAWIWMSGIVFNLAGGGLAELSWRTPFLLYLLALPLIPAAILFLKEPADLAKEPVSETANDADSKRLRPTIITLYVLTLVGTAAYFMVPTQLPFHLGDLGVSEPSLIGVAIATMTIGSAIASLYYQRVRGRANVHLITALSFGGMAAGFLMVAFTTSYQGILISMIIAGLGRGLFIPHMSLMVIILAPEHLRGRLVGGLTASLYLGQFLSPLVTQPASRAVGLPTTFLGASIILFLITGIYLIRAVQQRSQPIAPIKSTSSD